MKKIKKQIKIFYLLQLFFTFLTFVGGILFFAKVLPNATMSIICMFLCLFFGFLKSMWQKKLK